MPTAQQLASQRAQAQRAAAGYKQTPAAGARPPVKPPGAPGGGGGTTGPVGPQKPPPSPPPQIGGTPESGWPKGPGGVPHIPGGTVAPPAPIGGSPGGRPYGDVPPPWMGGGDMDQMQTNVYRGPFDANGRPAAPPPPGSPGAGTTPPSPWEQAANAGDFNQLNQLLGKSGPPMPTNGGQTWTPDSGQSIGDWMSSLPGGGGGVDPNLANQRQANEQARQLAIQQSPGPLNQLPGPSGWPKDPSGNPTVPPAQKNFDSGTDFIRSDP